MKCQFGANFQKLVSSDGTTKVLEHKFGIENPRFKIGRKVLAMLSTNVSHKPDGVSLTLLLTLFGNAFFRRSSLD